LAQSYVRRASRHRADGGLLEHRHRGCDHPVRLLTILNLCVDLPSIENTFCRLVSRDPLDGRVTAVSTSQVNAARLTARGIDFGLSYRTRLGGGQLRVEASGTYLLRHMVESTPSVVTGTVRYTGDWEHPRWQGTAKLSWDIGALAAALNLPAYVYADASLGYKFDGGLTASVGVRNISDSRPPLVYPVYKDTMVYDQVEQYVFTSVVLLI
jgi:iron complex outermembrane receptor protein